MGAQRILDSTRSSFSVKSSGTGKFPDFGKIFFVIGVEISIGKTGISALRIGGEEDSPAVSGEWRNMRGGV